MTCVERLHANRGVLILFTSQSCPRRTLLIGALKIGALSQRRNVLPISEVRPVIPPGTAKMRECAPVSGIVLDSKNCEGEVLVCGNFRN
jgi:hypothetical protein